ncbi:MAG: Anthranilate synthase component 1 [Methanomassiliicoccales archaeon PtaU1.Bin124]|nr:MAG: Anthranilate synthase component 1 [Methanomassiliicoccales archaeon PtaU1.Bin124]
MSDSPRVHIEDLQTNLTPMELYGQISQRARTSFLLESAVGAERTVSYSFIGCCPKFVLRCDDGKVTGSPEYSKEGPIGAIKKAMEENELSERMFPFMGGLVGYFSYEFARYLEEKVPFLRDPSFPDYELGFYKEAVVFDHSKFKCYYMSIDGTDNLRRMLDSMDLKTVRRPLLIGRTHDQCPRPRYEGNVSSARQRIAEGESFQVVVSRSKEIDFTGDPLALYQELRQVNPSPYMYYLDFGERKVLGSSPETLVTVRGGEVFTYPIAGTRPLGANMKERRRYKEEMRADEKEKAEHAMLVDLARNDLGKVCEEGSVHVAEYMQVEEFSHVQHLVSKVQGTLAPGLDAMDAFTAVFPAGTVSGAPKPRAMEIIAELEQRPRGPYAGAVGYISLNGDMDSAIAIRSAFVAKDRIRIQAGAGIVYDSDPSKEFVETENKLEGVVAALQRSATNKEANV